MHEKEEIKKCNEKEALGRNASDNQVKKRETEGYDGGGGGGGGKKINLVKGRGGRREGGGGGGGGGRRLKIINPLNERSDMFK